jgi:hypothetical protein
MSQDFEIKDLDIKKFSDEFDDDYKSISKVDAFVDTVSNTLIDKDDISHFEKIKGLANKLNVNLLDPNKSCRKCYGKGYVAIDNSTKTPIPCDCIFKDKVDSKTILSNTIGQQPNRGMRRKFDRIKKLQKKAIIKLVEKSKHKNNPTKASVKKDNRLKMVKKIRKINRKNKK